MRGLLLTTVDNFPCTRHGVLNYSRRARVTSDFHSPVHYLSFVRYLSSVHVHMSTVHYLFTVHYLSCHKYSIRVLVLCTLYTCPVLYVYLSCVHYLSSIHYLYVTCPVYTACPVLYVYLSCVHYLSSIHYLSCTPRVLVHSTLLVLYTLFANNVRRLLHRRQDDIIAALSCPLHLHAT